MGVWAFLVFFWGYVECFGGFFVVWCFFVDICLGVLGVGVKGD